MLNTTVSNLKLPCLTHAGSKIACGKRASLKTQLPEQSPIWELHSDTSSELASSKSTFPQQLFFKTQCCTLGAQLFMNLRAMSCLTQLRFVDYSTCMLICTGCTRAPTHGLHTPVPFAHRWLFQGCMLPESFVVVVHSLVSDSRNSADQPNLFPPFYSCLLATHMTF